MQADHTAGRKRDETYGCLPFQISNDRWGWATVLRLNRRLAKQQTPLERRAALVVGPGGLPYLFGSLRVATVYNVDLDAPVLETTAERIRLLQEHSDWNSYNDAISELLGGPAVHAHEIWNVSRLARGYDNTRAGAAQAELQSYQGDLLELTTTIGETAMARQQVFTLINVTNVANYVGNGHGTGRQRISRALQALPLATDSVILDSSPNLIQRPYSVERYGVSLAGTV